MQSQRKRSPRLVRRNRALALYLRVVLCGAKSLGVISIELRLKMVMVHVTVYSKTPLRKEVVQSSGEQSYFCIWKSWAASEFVFTEDMVTKSSASSLFVMRMDLGVAF